MKKLSYKTLDELSYDGYLLKDAPERILQFGEGNFMRGFVDYFVDVMNEKVGFNSKIVVCQPIENGLSEMINEQDSLYTLYLRGRLNGEKVNQKRVISSLSRCINPYKEYNKLMECAKNADLRFITCNTTESGIVLDADCRLEDTPPKSFPAKLTQFLYERFNSFENAKGFVILSCELIDNNGKELQKCVNEYAKLWQLPEAFIDWLTAENIFCSTLVDRIVTGYPRSEADALCEELGYKDDLIDTAEIFGFWAIEGPASLANELPFKEANLPVVITEDSAPYKQRKVRILNGAHTSMVLGAYLAGQNIVREAMQDDVIRSFMNKTIAEEIIPTLTLPKDELEEFAASVVDRFDNPFIDHELLAISLNSTSKWKARVMPSLKAYIAKYDKLPECIVASFAFYIAFFSGTKLADNALIGKRGDEQYKILDDMDVLEFYYANKDASSSELVSKVCSNIDFWGEDLNKINGFSEMVLKYLDLIKSDGAYAVMEKCIKK